MIGIQKRKGKAEKGTYTVTNSRIKLFCPSCGRASALSHKIHKIDDQGNVTPILQCPYDDCIFKDFVKLLDW